MDATMTIPTYAYFVWVFVTILLIATLVWLSIDRDRLEDKADALDKMVDTINEKHQKLQRQYAILETLASSKLNDWIVLNIQWDDDQPIPYVLPSNIEHFN